MSLAGAIADARKSAARMYINNFADKGRQNTTDMLLVRYQNFMPKLLTNQQGRLKEQSPVLLYDPIHDFMISELKKRQAVFS